jgi:hypothetical protein
MGSIDVVVELRWISRLGQGKGGVTPPSKENF